MRWLRDRIRWLRATDLRLAAQLVAIGVLLLGFLALGDEVAELDTESFDHSILLALRHAPDDPIGPAWFEAGVMNLSALGSGAVAGLIVAIAIGFLALAGRRRYAVVLAIVAGGTWLAMVVLKTLYDRQRPTIVTHIDPTGSLSFPSGHSMIAAAIYITLAMMIARALPTRRLKLFVVGTGALLAMLIGVTRVYLGVHYPTDVVAGWTVGMAWALVCGLVTRWIGARSSVMVDAAGPEPGSGRDVDDDTVAP